MTKTRGILPLRYRVWSGALVVVAALLAAGTGAAAASPVVQPDVNGLVPAGRLSASGERAALRALAGERRAGAGEQSVTVGALTFNVFPFAVQILPPGEATLYFASAPLTPLVDTGLEDTDGVRMVMLGGQEFNHVSAQARYGLLNVNAYRATGDPTYLTRAEAQAQRLIDRATDAGGAWFHPYDYEWGSMQPPWYSALGQGYALSLFTRLYELTGDETYRGAADATFASFLVAGPTTTPWVSDVDPNGYLWLQEYPGSSDLDVLNGFLVAALGIYDYYRVTGDPDALALFRGAATTVADNVVAYRQRGWCSLYCLGDRLTASASYHEVVVQQLLALFTITGDTRFAQWADTFEGDFSRRAVGTKATIGTGTQCVVQFTAGGGILRERTFKTRTVLRPMVSQRSRIYGRPGYWLLIATGKWKGYWIREGAPRVFVPGELVALPYSPSRSLTLPAGRSYTFHHYSSSGAVSSTAVLSPTVSTTVQIDTRAIVNGVIQVRVASSPFGGSWIRLSGCPLQ